MLLANYLDAKLICFEYKIVTKEQVYNELIKRICHHYPLPVCGDKLLDLVLARDRESSTAYPTGIAIPHIRMDGINDTIISMCWLSNPIDFDGQEVDWIVLIITDKSSSKTYLNTVAALLRTSKDIALTSVLKHSHDGHDVIYTLKKADVKVKANLSISDIMISDVYSILPDTLLSELSTIMNEKHFSFLPVADSNMNYLGEVNVLNLLKVGVPDYLMMLNDLSFLQSYEPLENLFKTEDQVTVGEIMCKDMETLTSDTSIIEAVFKMIQRNKRYFAIVDNGKLKGIVTAMDIIKKVLKA